MNRLATLRAELTALTTEGKAILAREVNDKLSEADEAAYAALEAKLEGKRAEIAAAETAERRRATLAATVTRPAMEAVTNDPDPKATFGFKALAEFAGAVREAGGPGRIVDQRLYGAAGDNSMTGGGTAGEGFEVPPEYRDRIFEVMHDLDGIFDRTDVEPTTRRTVEFAADETTPWGSTGVQAYWRAEGSTLTESKLDTQGRTVTLHELYGFVTATDELLEDSPRVESRLTRKTAEAISWKRDSAVVYGTGAGQPLGWFNSGALVTVDKVSGQAADTILAENVLDMYSRLLVVPGDQPFWLANRDTVRQLAMLKIGDMPVWMPPSGLMAAPGGSMLGYPVLFSEHAKTVGDKGDIQLVSAKGYYALRREQGPKFASSMHLLFDQAKTAFRWTFRLGGQPHLSAPISPANGSNTKSHFVALQARA